VGLRLALAFIAVAVLAVALVAVLAVVFTDRDIRWWRSTQAAQTSGIGQAVAAELARAHHGSIEIARDAGEGSRFTLILPLATGAALQLQPRRRRHPGAARAPT
jgi:K+-sensing histidine kinase KdpD